MTMFLLVAALLLIAALLFVMPALLSAPNTAKTVVRNELNLDVLRDQLRELDTDFANGIIDQESYDNARKELEKRVATDVLADDAAPRATSAKPAIAVAIGLVVPIVAISLYFYMGNPSGLDPAQAKANAGQSAEITQEQIIAMVATLEQKLKANPNDVQGWEMLARSYHIQGRYRESAGAYEQLIKLVPDNAEILADYADVLGMAQNKSLQGEPEKIIARALQIDPKNVKALALAGSAAFDERDYQNAVMLWKKILDEVDPQSDMGRSIASSIAEAQAMVGGVTAPAIGATPAAAPTQAASAPQILGKAVEGDVSIDPSFKNQVDGETTVFIFARAEQGPRFPLAVLKKQVKDLPLHFKLDDSMGMMPNVKLSDFSSVVVGARVSSTGSATPQAGDLEGIGNPVAPGATGLKIVINTRHQ